MKYISIITIVLLPLFFMEIENIGNCKEEKQAQVALMSNQLENLETSDSTDAGDDPKKYIEDIAQKVYASKKVGSALHQKDKKKKKDEPTFSEKCSELQKKSDADKVNPAVVKVIEKVKKPLQRQESGGSNAKQGISVPITNQVKEERKNISAKLAREVYSSDDIKPSLSKKNLNDNQIKDIKTLKEQELKDRNILLQEKSRLSRANEVIKTECRSSSGKDPKSKLIKGE